MKIQENVNLSNFNTFKVEGNARYFVVIKNGEELKEAVDFSEKNQLTVFILGGGSNLLISDQGCDGLVLKIEIKRMKQIEVAGGNWWNVGAGENFDDFIKHVLDKGFCGVENLSHIPGSVGASVVQNIGAYGVEIKDFVKHVKVFDIKTKKTKLLERDECKFGYRNSFFKQPEGRNLIVLEVMFGLKKNQKPKIDYKDIQNYLVDFNTKDISAKDLREIIIDIRSKKFPDLEKVGTAGSFFKNPILTKEKLDKLIEEYPEVPFYENGNNTYKVSLAYILDKILGLKGFRRGRVGLYDKQVLVLVNYGGGTSKEIKELVKEITKEVKSKIDVDIHPEVVIW